MWKSLSPSLLADLFGRATEPSLEQLKHQAGNPNTAPSKLEELSRHPSHSVRRAVSRNPGIPEGACRVLLRDRVEDVALGTLTNKECSPAAVLDFLHDVNAPHHALLAERCFSNSELLPLMWVALTDAGETTEPLEDFNFLDLAAAWGFAGLPLRSGVGDFTPQA